jgi:hypothetical protein
MDGYAFRYAQDDLTALGRAQLDKREYYLDNQLFGFDQIIRAYAGLPADDLLPWAMEPTISFEDPNPHHSLANLQLPVVFSVTDVQADVLRRQLPMPIVAIGSSFWYAQAVYHQRHPQEPREPSRRGTLVFPDKSTWFVDTDFDRDQFARQLAALPEEYQPVAVSVTWRDVERGSHLPYLNAGLQLVSSGFLYDPLFLFRQYDLCRRFKYSCANDLSTSFCMSVLAGCRFFFWKTGPLHMTRFGVSNSFAQDPTLVLPGKRMCIDASPFPPTGHGQPQRELAERFAGKAFVRSPQFFREWFAEGRRRLQAQPPPPMSPSQDRATPRNDDLAGWLAWGVDCDGWARDRCGLVLPPRANAEGIHLRLEIPPRTNPDWRATWEVALDDERFSLAVQAGHWILELPCRQRPCRVAIRSDAAIPLGDPDQRDRTFLIQEIRWREKGLWSRWKPKRPRWAPFGNQPRDARSGLATLRG